MGYKLNFIIIFAAICLSELSYSQPDFQFTSDNDCSEKRLDVPPEVASKVPVQDQDGIGLCAAYANAQLIDSWRLKYDQPVNDFTSPLSFGIQYSAKKNIGRLHDLVAIDMLEYSKNMESCSYNVVRDQFNSKTSGDFISELARHFKKAKQDPSQKEEAAKAVVNCVLSAGLNKTVDIAQINRYFEEEHWVQFTNKIIEDLCKGHKKPLAFLPKVEKKRSVEFKNHNTAMNEFRAYLNHRLNQKGALPVGISYCKKVLKDKDAEGVNEQGRIDGKACKDEAHFSVVVGRRLLKYQNQTTGKTETICQFLVRNSYGSSCNGYDEFEKDSIPSKPGGEKPRVCENGQIWVDENALLRNTAELFHLKDK